MEIFPTIIIAIALVAGFGLIALLAWEGWRDRHERLAAAKPGGRRTL